MTRTLANRAEDPRQLGLPAGYLPTPARIRRVIEQFAEEHGLSVEVLTQREGERRLAQLQRDAGARSPRPRQLLLVRPARRNHRWSVGLFRCERCEVWRRPVFEREINGKRLVVYEYLVLGAEWSRKRPDCVERTSKGGSRVGTH